MAETETKKRGNGPFAVTYLTDKGETAKRFAANCSTVVIDVRNGKPVHVDIGSVSDTMLRQFAAYGIAAKAKSALLTAVGNDGDLAAEAASLVKDIAAGDVFAVREAGEKGSGKRGKQFDFDYYLAVSVEFYKQLKKPAPNDAQLAGLRTKLEAMTSEERAEQVKKWRTHPVYVYAETRIKALRAQEAAKNVKVENDATADMF
jgi:hypothetical protein